MAVLFKLSRGQVKPQGVPRIDWTHPLAQGLVFYAFDTGTGVVLDLVGNRPQNFAGTIDPSGATPWGTGKTYGGSGAVYFNSDADIRNPQTAQFSCACAYVQTGTVAAYTRPFGRTAENGGGQPYYNWDWEINPVGNGQNIVSFNAAAGSFTTTRATWTGNANNVFTSLLTTVNAPATTAIGYAQGQSIGQDTTDGASNDNNGDYIIFAAGTITSPSSFIGSVFYGALWNRVLTAAEALQLHLDPYCFLIPAEAEMPALFVSGGAAAASLTPFRRPMRPFQRRF